MILTCPECETRFVIPDDAIGTNGRTVRCSQCSATWFVAYDPEVFELQDNQAVEMHQHQYDAQKDTYEHEDVPGGSPLADDFTQASPDRSETSNIMDTAPSVHTILRDQSERKKVRKRLFGVGLIWIVTLALLSALAASAYFFRAQIVEQFPGTDRIYKTLGIEATASGLEFYDVEGKFGENNGVPVLFVSGMIKNYDNRTRPVGMIYLEFKNTNGEDIGDWAVEPPKATLAAGESLKFNAQYPNPPVDAVGLTASFVSEGK